MKYLIIVLSAFLLLSCGEKHVEQEQYINATFKGHVTGYDKALNLFGLTYRKTIELDNAGNFSSSLDSIPEGNYTLALGSETFLNLYFKNGTHLQMDINLNKIEARDKKAVSISGDNTEETQLLYALMINAPAYQYDRAAYKEVYLPKIDKKNPKEFEAFQLELLEKERAIIKEYTDKYDIEEAFLTVKNVELLLKYDFTFKLYDRNWKRSNPDKNWTIPARFKAYFKDEIPQNDFSLYHKSSRYAMYVREGYYEKLRTVLNQYERESLDYFKAEIAYLDTCTFPEIIRTDMYNGLTISYMRANDSAIRTYLEKEIYQKVSDVSTLKRFEDFKAGENAFADGKPAPQFTLTDIKGKKVSFSDFKGKMVMIDCWATWCAPCIKGLPKFKALKDKYAGKNIVFIAISVDEDVELWKRKVTENKGGVFTGIQLNTSINPNTFKKDMMVQGIPRYILIGADGNIIKREAPHPGTDELYQLIDSNLN